MINLIVVLYKNKKELNSKLKLKVQITLLVLKLISSFLHF